MTGRAATDTTTLRNTHVVLHAAAIDRYRRAEIALQDGSVERRDVALSPLYEVTTATPAAL